MSPFLVGVLLVMGVLIAASLHRVWGGPTVFDRLAAVALVSVNGVVVIVLLGFVFERTALFLDIALAYALLAFMLPIALGRYFDRRTAESDDGTTADDSLEERSDPPAGTVQEGSAG